jgi:hypothetical protein
VSRAGVVAAALAVAVTVASCGSPYPGSTLGQQVRSWARTTGLAASLQALQADGGRLPRVEAEHDPAAVRTACDVLVQDALAANQNLPAPDARLTSVLSAAYAAAAAAGRDCLRSAGGGAGLAASATELSRAATGYVKAQARLDDLDATGSGASS